MTAIFRSDKRHLAPGAPLTTLALGSTDSGVPLTTLDLGSAPSLPFMANPSELAIVSHWVIVTDIRRVPPLTTGKYSRHWRFSQSVADSIAPRPAQRVGNGRRAGPLSYLVIPVRPLSAQLRHRPSGAKRLI